MRFYRKLLRALFAQAIKFEVSALQTRMMALEQEIRKLQSQNEKLKNFVLANRDVQDQNLRILTIQTRAFAKKIGHQW